MVTAIIHSAETIGDAYAPSLNAAFTELESAFGFWPVVLAPYGGARTVAEQRKINPAISPLLSDHVKGRAVDIDNQRSFRNINQKLFLSILASHGWRNVQVNGAPFTAEPWHFANRSTNPAGGGATPLPTPQQEETLFTVFSVKGQTNNYTILGAAGTYVGVSSAMVNLLAPQQVYTPAPTKVFNTQAEMDALIRQFPPVGSGRTVVDIDEAALAAALGPYIASKADVTAAVTAIKAAIPTKLIVGN